jgi:hypothetical protein
MTIGFAKWAQADIDVSNMGLDATGIAALMSALETGNAATINYERQNLYSHSDQENTAAAASFATMNSDGWSRTGNYTTGRLAYEVTVGASATHTIPLVNGTYDYQVDWGDGTVEQGKTDATEPSHVYAVAGTYTITITGHSCTGFRFNNAGSKLDVTAISEINADNLGMNNMSSMFYGCSNLTGPVPSTANMTSVVTFGSAFRGTAITGTPDLSGLTSCTNFTESFRDCTGAFSMPDLTVLTSATLLTGMFRDSTVTGTPVFTGMSSVTSISAFAFQCAGINGVIDTSPLSGCTVASSAFRSCIGITTENPTTTGMTSLVDSNNMYFGCTGLTGTPDFTDAGSLTGAGSMYYGATGLSGTPDLSPLVSLSDASFLFRQTGISGTIDLSPLSSLTNAQQIVRLSGVTAFTIGSSPTVNCANWTDSFSATAVDAASLDAWLISMDTNAVVTGTFDYSTTTGNTHLDSARSAAASTAITNLIAAGWVRSGTY